MKEPRTLIFVSNLLFFPPSLLQSVVLLIIQRKPLSLIFLRPRLWNYHYLSALHSIQPHGHSIPPSLCLSCLALVLVSIKSVTTPPTTFLSHTPSTDPPLALYCLSKLYLKVVESHLNLRETSQTEKPFYHLHYLFFRPSSFYEWDNFIQL